MRSAVAVILFSIPTSVVAQFADLENLTAIEQALLDEHAWFGMPSEENVLIRQGYVTRTTRCVACRGGWPIT